ncbi:MAG: magnesium transporter [Alphaproteobacteria bacterium]|nr:magnesium transporter [Alphaproteobacteria bacterium]
MLRVYTRSHNCLAPSDLAIEANARPPWPSAPTPWIDLLHPTAEEDRYVEHHTGVSIPTREEMLEIEASSRLYQENDAQFMTISALSQLETDSPVLSPFTFVLKGQTLVTVRYSEPKPLLHFSQRSQRPGAVACGNGEQVMMSIIEALIDRIADTLERIGSNIDTISRDVFRDRADGEIKSAGKVLQSNIVDLGRQGELLSMVRESLISINRALTYHTAVIEDDKKALKDARMRIRTVQRDVASLTEHTGFLSSKVTFLLDAMLGMINLEQNQIIKIFSIASVCLMPPTLIASLYGMNFKNMPELGWSFGYPMAIGAMIISAILPFLYFRKKGWF